MIHILLREGQMFIQFLREGQMFIQILREGQNAIQYYRVYTVPGNVVTVNALLFSFRWAWLVFEVVRIATRPIKTEEMFHA